MVCRIRRGSKGTSMVRRQGTAPGMLPGMLTENVRTPESLKLAIAGTGQEARGRSWSQGPTSAIPCGGLQKKPRRKDGAETRDSGESRLLAKRRGYFEVQPSQEPGPSPFL